jgi:hypothetical protein
MYIYYHQAIKDHKGNPHLGDTHEPGARDLGVNGLLAMAGIICRRLAL